MPVASACPNRNQLSELIAGTLPDGELQRLTEHLGECATCQLTLQSIATGEIPIARLVTQLDEATPPNQSAYWKAISGLEVERNASHDTSALKETSTSDPPSSLSPLADELAFLEPSNDPAFIGQLHHFLVTRVIGRGGMGIVLEAFDTHLHRNVAIKVLNPKFQQNEVARQRFCREGRAAAAISHEHVVAMHHVAKANEGEVAYLVMQLIDGDTLEDRLSDARPLPRQDVARIGMQIAAGLSAAHARDMVHRDIKPGNVLIEAETERVKLTDFGLARATDDVKLTQTGMVTGTPLYMSPEQAVGGTADERSDLFSLGAVMYEMATGVSPFQAASAVGVMKRIMDEAPEPPSKVNSTISKPLSDIIMTLLSKKPEDRPASAASVATALAGIVTEFGPISPLQVPSVAAAEAKRLSGDHRVVHRRWIMGGWIASSITVVALIAALVMLMVRPGGQPKGDPFPSVLLPDNPGTVWSVDFAPDGNRIAAGIEDGTVRLWDIESQEVVKSFSAHRGVVWMVQFHPMRPIMASCGDDGRIKLWEAESFELLKEWRAENAVRGVAFSPDGNRMVAGDREGVIHIYDIDTGKELATRTQPGAIFAIDFAPDGKSVVTGGSDKIVRLWDAQTLEQRQSMPGHDGPIYNVRFAEQGNLLATVGWNKNIRVWNTETGSQIHSLPGSEGDVWGVAFCGDGTHLVTSGQDAAARVFQLSDGTITTTLRGHDSAVHNISLDPVRHRIATSSRDGTIRVWDLSSLNE